jgi:fructose-1,6-bisphosphatase/inositol monophosphatase family enzyme
MTVPDSGKLGEAVVAAVREVAETYILPRYQKLAKGDVRAKTHPGDLVTVADIESEQALSKILPALWPGSEVIGEEAAAADAAVLSHLAGDSPVWIIDPVDGTSNFVDGRPTFGVIIALVQRGETLMGWIHDPVAHRTLWAEKGAGAWLQEQAGTPIRMHLPEPPGETLNLLTAGLYAKHFAPLKTRFARIVRLGSAAHDYWSLVDGRMHVLSFSYLKPWDHAAGMLIHTEAGGYTRLVNGASYSPAARDQPASLSAPNKNIWDAIVKANMS